MKADLIVTRHPALHRLLIELGIADENTPVVAHATIEQIRGKVVAGVLPLDMAAECANVIVVPLALEPDDRGRELSLKRLRAIAGKPRVFKVTEAS